MFIYNIRRWKSKQENINTHIDYALKEVEEKQKHKFNMWKWDEEKN